MPLELSQLLQRAVESETAHLRTVTESEAALKTSTGWSRKEELGHLIDSASNNHLRFVRAALEPEFRGPSYDQNGSVKLHGYQELLWPDLVEFWRSYNSILAQVIARIPQDKLQTICRVGNDAPVTLQFVIEDYVAHMQHHLDHILRRETVTQYPRPA
jgi:DinB superfamily